MSELTDKQWSKLVEDAAYYEELARRQEVAVRKNG